MRISPEYAAAFLDGEGCISITCSHHKNGRLFTQLKVMVTNTDEQIIRDFCDEMGARFSTYQNPHKPHHRRTYRAWWQGQRAVDFLCMIRPFLRIKGTQADLACKFWGYMHTRKRRTRTPEDIAQEYLFHRSMKTLNKRGQVAS